MRRISGIIIRQLDDGMRQTTGLQIAFKNSDGHVLEYNLDSRLYLKFRGHPHSAMSLAHTFPFHSPKLAVMHRAVVAHIQSADYKFELPLLSQEIWERICDDPQERKRLEFVGDSRIGSFVSEELYKCRPSEGPGFYTVSYFSALLHMPVIHDSWSVCTFSPHSQRNICAHYVQSRLPRYQKSCQTSRGRSGNHNSGILYWAGPWSFSILCQTIFCPSHSDCQQSIWWISVCRLLFSLWNLFLHEMIVARAKRTDEGRNTSWMFRVSCITQDHLKFTSVSHRSYVVLRLGLAFFDSNSIYVVPIHMV